MTWFSETRPDRARRARMLPCVVLASVLALAAAAAPRGAAVAGPLDGKARWGLEAVFLTRFASFTSWPESCPSGGPLVVGVLGPDPLGEALDRAARGRHAGTRPLAVRRHGNVTEVGACGILFLSPKIRGETLASVLQALRGKRVLTVGHEPGFTEAGGMIGFFPEDGKLRFTVNGAAAEAEGLRISARLLQLAHLPPERNGANR